MAKAKATEEKVILLPKLMIKNISITLQGDSPLISHKWSEKAKKEMRDKQMKKAKQAREAKDPEKDFHDSLYHMPDGSYGFPAIAFKAAAVKACTHIKGVPMTVARGAFHINVEMVKIKGKPTIREDMVKVGPQKTADLRYRGEFKEWSATFNLRYNSNMLSDEQIVNLFNTAGFSIGIGEWRPEKSGSYGMFHVV